MHQLVIHFAKPAIESSIKRAKKQLKDIERVESMDCSALKPGHYDEEKAQIRANIHEMEEALDDLKENGAELDELRESNHEFNRALSFALELDSDDGMNFLRCWNEGDWAGCESFGFVVPVSDELSKGVSA